MKKTKNKKTKQTKKQIKKFIIIIPSIFSIIDLGNQIQYFNIILKNFSD